MIYWHIFLAFLIPNIVGYGGGPPSIPLVKNEVADHYHWMNDAQFGEILAIGNTLPGPIATKMAGYIGYQQGGVMGAAIAIAATVLPSLIAMILLLQLLLRFKHSPRIKNMTMVIRPAVAVMLIMMALDFFMSSWKQAGAMHLAVLAIAGFIAMERMKVHPFFVIAASLIYGFILI